MPLLRDIHRHRHRHLWANVNYISCRSWPEGGWLTVQRCVDMTGLILLAEERRGSSATVTVGCLFATSDALSIGHIARQHVSSARSPQHLRDRTTEWLETVTAIVQWLLPLLLLLLVREFSAAGARSALWTWPPGTWPNDDRFYWEFGTIHMWKHTWCKQTHYTHTHTCVLFVCLINLPAAGIAGKCNFFIYTWRYCTFAEVCTAHMSNQLYCPLALFDILINVYL